jgi:hypothetical protein
VALRIVAGGGSVLLADQETETLFFVDYLDGELYAVRDRPSDVWDFAKWVPVKFNGVDQMVASGAPVCWSPSRRDRLMYRSGEEAVLVDMKTKKSVGTLHANKISHDLVMVYVLGWHFGPKTFRWDKDQVALKASRED